MESIMIETLYKFLIDEDTYERIKTLNPELNMQDDYKHFIDWHHGVIMCDLSNRELRFLSTLCDMFMRGSIRSMDEEHCSEMVCNSYYYTTDLKLVIVTPR